MRLFSEWEEKAVFSEQFSLIGESSGSFEFQKKSFDVRAVGVTGQFPVFPENSVTGNDDGYRIVGTGISHSSGPLRISEKPGDVAVCSGLSVGNGRECPPYCLIKIRLILQVESRSKIA